MSKSDKAARATSRLRPEREVIYNGVAITVRPLRWHQVPKLLDILEKLYLMGKTGVLDSLASGSFEGLNRLLDQCVSCADVPDFTIEDLPLYPMAEILDIVYEQNVDLKNWEALIRKRSVEWGIDLASLTKKWSSDQSTPSH